jgi:tetratricopeptide (TPR) repeat protein
MRTIITIAFCGFIFITNISAQKTKLDSIWKDKNVHDTIKIQDIINLGIEKQKQSLDSALYYFQWAVNITDQKSRSHKRFKELQSDALKYSGNIFWRQGKNDLAVDNISKAAEIQKVLNNNIGVADNINTIGVIYASQSKYLEAQQYFQQFLDIGNELNNLQIIAKAHNNFGLIYWNTGEYEKAIEAFMQALKLNEELGNKVIMGGNYNNIGNIHKDQGNLDKAIEYYSKALEISIELDNKQHIAGCYNNIGAVYADQGKAIKNNTDRIENLEKAIEYYKKALEVSESLKDKRLISMCHKNLGSAFYEKGKCTEVLKNKKILFDQAIENFNKSQQLKQEINDKSGLAMVYESLTMLYIELAKILPEDKKERKESLDYALVFAKKSEEIAEETGSLPRRYDAAKAMFSAHKAQKNCFESVLYAEQLITLKDSLFSDEKAKALAEVETRYETEKKQQEIEKQRIQIEKQVIQRNSFIIGFILMIILFVVIFIGYRNKIKANRQIKSQNADLEQANAEILAQRDEIEAQRDMVISQRDKLEEVHNHMTDSLRYAQSIQAAILPSEKVLQQISPEYFVLMKPCELVSGDFYWATSFDEYQIFCVADCTGHGVPGAFMSILGITALNDIVARHRVTSPSDILGYLRESVIEALSQNDTEHMHKDGMDIGICIYSSKSRILQFAGARISMWLVTESDVKIDIETSLKNEFLIHDSYKLIEIKGNAMPVGISPKMVPFEAATIKLHKNTVSIYIITDGFADQHGGENRAKFGSGQLKKLILKNIDLDFNKQKEQLIITYNNWKGDNYQIDDVTVLGIRL